MHWPSFFIGLLTFPVLISALLLARLLLELAILRYTRKVENFELSEDSVT